MPACRCCAVCACSRSRNGIPPSSGIIGELALSIEGGSTFSEGLAQHPKVFNRLFVNMVKAGELGGVLEVVLNRLSEFMEKAQKIKGKVIAAMFYPSPCWSSPTAILIILMVIRDSQVQGSVRRHGRRTPLPAFTRSCWASARRSKTTSL